MSILAVSEQPAVLVVAEKLLRAGGFVNVAASQDGTLIVPGREHEPWDLILLDLAGSQTDGYELISEVQQSGQLHVDRASGGPVLPVIVIVEDQHGDALGRALRCGASDFVTQPIDETALMWRMRSQLKLRQRALELDERLQTVEADLERERLESAQRLTQAVESRDRAKIGHFRRIELVAAAIAGRLGFTREECWQLGRAARLHDIGMIAVPDAIVLKQGGLTEAERDMMRAHTTIGAEILIGSRSPLLRMAEEIARSHHEQWSGGGYPGGLAGPEIPLAARIVAVADVFDVLTHVRPYAETLSASEAAAEIEAHGATQFDPKVVAAFREIDLAMLVPHAENPKPDSVSLSPLPA
jgi:putative two-component system response regulator